MHDRYQADGPQSLFEPGSDGQVLANSLGITDREKIDEIELEGLAALYEAVLIDDLPRRALRVDDLNDWHRRWLGALYPWAGELRSINVGKGGFVFASAARIPQLLADFERDCLLRFTPCNPLHRDALVEAIAITHVELILIHPFREGNGRLARVVADVMAVQGGYLSLDYSAWDADREAYFAAIRRGQAMDYRAITALVAGALRD